MESTILSTRACRKRVVAYWSLSTSMGSLRTASLYALLASSSLNRSKQMCTLSLPNTSQRNQKLIKMEIPFFFSTLELKVKKVALVSVYSKVVLLLLFYKL